MYPISARIARLFLNDKIKWKDYFMNEGKESKKANNFRSSSQTEIFHLSQVVTILSRISLASDLDSEVVVADRTLTLPREKMWCSKSQLLWKNFTLATLLMLVFPPIITDIL